MSRPVPLARRLAVGLALTAAGLFPSGSGPSAARGNGCLCGTLADEFRAADAGLVREWIVQVPFDSAAYRLSGVTVGDGLVLAQSGDGGLHAIRTAPSAAAPARVGTVAWSTTVGAAAGHAWPATVGSRLVTVASELAVHALDRDSGIVEWERPTDALTAASPIQAGDWVYTPLATNRLLRLPVNPLRDPAADAEPPAAVAGRGAGDAAAPTPPESLEPVSIAAGGRYDQPPVPLDDGILWSTANGLVAIQRTPLGWIRHEFPEANPAAWARGAPLVLTGPPVVRGNSIFIAAADSGVARIDLNAPNKPGLRAAWTAALPDRAASVPFVSGDTVVVSIGPSGFVGLSAADGRERWRSSLVGTLVAVAAGRAWILDDVGRLTALDLATGSRRLSVCMGCFTLPVINTLSERLVLASPGGLVVCLAAPNPPPVAAVDAAPPQPVNAADAAPAAEPGPGDPDATLP
jgi:outer membrane protein assembly factor BamB